jgi:hypothetical protein
MEIAAAIFGVVLLAVLAVDVFETIVLPRRVAGRFRLTAVFYRVTWLPWRWVATLIPNKKRREAYLSIYGPLSLLVLLAFWASVLIVSFAFLRWAALSDVAQGGGRVTSGTELYISAISFVGMEESVPRDTWARSLTVLEALSGFALLAMVIGYLPVLYQSFSRRESTITLLDARAGSPPSASELLQRFGRGADGRAALPELLRDWEHWAAELLESHVSYPVLGFFRSQHDNQSWLGSMTAILDVCTLIMAGIEEVSPFQAELTFAMARHAIVDLAKIFNVPPMLRCHDRLPPDDLVRLRASLAKSGVRLREGGESEKRLAELRRMYEPYVEALSQRLLMELPQWTGDNRHNWTTSKWEKFSGSVALH